jgi:hypothetical protein
MDSFFFYKYQKSEKKSKNYKVRSAARLRQVVFEKIVYSPDDSALTPGSVIKQRKKMYRSP